MFDIKSFVDCRTYVAPSLTQMKACSLARPFSMLDHLTHKAVTLKMQTKRGEEFFTHNQAVEKRKLADSSLGARQLRWNVVFQVNAFTEHILNLNTNTPLTVSVLRILLTQKEKWHQIDWASKSGGPW